MNRLPDFRLSRLASNALAALWMALSLSLLSACGPGTGGTGTGPIAFTGSAGGGTAVVGAGVSAGAIALPGGACSACDRLDLRLDEGAVELALPCGRFSFAGPWDPTARELLLPGRFEPAGGGAGRAATLRLQFGETGADGPQVQVTLLDEAGAVLAAAVLQRREGVPPPGACRP